MHVSLTSNLSRLTIYCKVQLDSLTTRSYCIISITITIISFQSVKPELYMNVRQLLNNYSDTLPPIHHVYLTRFPDERKL